MSTLFKIIKPLLFSLPAETAHNITLNCLKSGLYLCQKSKYSKALSQTVAGINFSNPVGLAAGFDKNAECMEAMFNMGMGFVEIGTATPRAQAGNPKPRVFRNQAHHAVINRMGFPNRGAQVFKRNLTTFLNKKQSNQIIGVNIGKNKDTEDPYKDYVELIKAFGSMSDYITVNISSPNTPGLRNLQKVDILSALIDRCYEAREHYCSAKKPPFFFKLAPDLIEDEALAVAQCLKEKNVNGVILTNTTLDRPNMLPASFKKQQGGLSGQPLTEKATNVIKTFYNILGKEVPIIGAGGIMSAQEAYDKIKAGATLIQIYTGLIYKGPVLIKEINEELPKLLEADGFSHISEAIGVNTK